MISVVNSEWNGWVWGLVSWKARRMELERFGPQHAEHDSRSWLGLEDAKRKPGEQEQRIATFNVDTFPSYRLRMPG